MSVKTFERVYIQGKFYIISIYRTCKIIYGMKKLDLIGDGFKPTLRYDEVENKVVLEGHIFAELGTLIIYYDTFLEWIDEFVSKKCKPLTVDLYLGYRDTIAEKKLILPLLKLLKKYEHRLEELIVNWHHDSFDTDSIEDCNMYTELTKLDIKLCSF